MSKHPMQKVRLDEHGVMRFTENAIVRYLLDAGPFDMNHLARVPFDDADREQFAQLIGYSVCGFDELSYVSDKSSEKAHKRVDTMMATAELLAKASPPEPPAHEEGETA